MSLLRSTLLRGVLLVILAASPADLGAQQIRLTPEQQVRLAEQFAPVLVFHPEERYFPTSPLFPIESELKGIDAALPQTQLGTPETRTAFYETLPLEEKAKIATVYYRAYPAHNSGGDLIVLEYWFYYVRNDYRVRSNVLPVWMSGNHPNDLEHIHLVVRGDAGRYVVDEIYASSHEGKIPANRYRYRNAHAGPTHFLVEQGSHALAPDIDEDGEFTIGTDGNSGAKIVWGIRDRGYTWPKYRKSYMDARTYGKSITFAYGFQGGAGSAQESSLPYRLVPVDAIVEDFSRLDLTESQRKSAFEDQAFWFTRVFGRDNGRSNALIMPPPAKSGGKSVGVKEVSSSERRLLVGTVLNVESQGLFVGGRYSYLTPSMYLPDLMFQIDGIVTRDGKYLSPQFLISYPLDGFTRIMGGRALVTDSLSFSRRQWDTFGTIEVRLGDMRISATTRSTGPIRGGAKEFRLFYAF